MDVRTPALLGGPPAIAGPIPPYRTVGPEEEAAAARVLKSGVLSAFFGSAGPSFLGGPEVRRFETAWSERFEVAHSISVNSATSGLIAAVGACGIGPDDEVIVPPFSMSATAACVRVWGATPVFADVRPDTFNLDPADVERNITPRTRAILAVNLMGQPADLDELLGLARPRGIRVIEDNAQAPGARYRGRLAGTVGDLGVFSLNCHKVIQTGEGGVVCTRDADLAQRVQLIRNHGEGVVRELGYSNRPEQILGFNFRLGELEAAIGFEQLRKLDRLTAPRVRIAQALNERLRRLPGLRVPEAAADRSHVYYTYSMTVDEAEAGISRSAVVRALAAEGVECFEGYAEPLYLQPLYGSAWHGKGERRYGRGLCPVSEGLYERSLFFHVLLHPELEPLAPAVGDAFCKVWDNRAKLASLANASRATRRS